MIATILLMLITAQQITVRETPAVTPPQVSPTNAASEFEAASIKPTDRRGPINTAPGLFIASGQTLKGLVAFAYGVRSFQILGATPWMESDAWQVQARAADGASEQSMNPMLRKMLGERFGLKARIETRNIQAYELVVDAGGLKTMRLSEDQSSPQPRFSTPGERSTGLQRGSAVIAGGPNGSRAFEGNSIKLDVLTNTLTNELGGYVVDKTGLTGLYDMKLRWTTQTQVVDPALGSEGSVFAAVQDLGLRLVSTKAPAEVVVIESANKPSPN